MRGLKDKVAIITGAAGGIGRSLVQRFLEEGARVAALDLNQAGLDELKGQFQQYAGQLATVQLDITDHDAVAKAVQRIHADLKQIDILVNNAGWDVAMQFVETTPDLWDKLIAINLKGPLSLQHAVVPLMVEAGGGKIVNIASDAGRVGSSGESVYAACKGGIIAFSKTLARETARNNVRVNVVCPGPTDTALLQSFTGGGEFGQKIYDGLKRAIPSNASASPRTFPAPWRSSQ